MYKNSKLFFNVMHGHYYSISIYKSSAIKHIKNNFSHIKYHRFKIKIFYLSIIAHLLQICECPHVYCTVTL